MEEFLNTLLGYCVSYGGKLLLALILLVVGFRLVNLLVKKLGKGKLTEKLDQTVSTFLCNAVAVTLKCVLLVSAIGLLGVPMSSVITVLATAGAAIGLALQGSLSNLAGGIMLMLFKPFRVGDYVQLMDVAGTVKEIDTFYTVLTTPDNKNITLPNGAVMNSNITNFSSNDSRRVDLTFNVAYDSDIDRVRDVLNSIAQAHPLVLKDPAPVVYLSKHGDSALEFVLRSWTTKDDYWTVYFDLNEAVKKAFDKTGIQIPFPQMDVHVKNEK